jgi:hypothetical protein
MSHHLPLLYLPPLEEVLRVVHHLLRGQDLRGLHRRQKEMGSRSNSSSKPRRVVVHHKLVGPLLQRSW